MSIDPLDDVTKILSQSALAKSAMASPYTTSSLLYDIIKVYFLLVLSMRWTRREQFKNTTVNIANLG